MKLHIKTILLTITCLMLAGCGESDNYKDSNSSSSSSRGPSKKQYSEKVCQDPYGRWHSSISRCSTCGTSYCVEYLPYGQYCSQGCCAAYEGLSSKCGY